MLYYADLHIHSKYSRATSKDCNLEQLALSAKKKGLSIISTGDFTHPAWFYEIKEKLTQRDNGTFTLKDDISKSIFEGCEPSLIPSFVLSVEISTIYKRGDKTRKVHHVVFVPNLDVAQNLRNKLDAIGNINSDGRPILGLDSRNLLEIVLESGADSYIIPAHIWTPWFSVLGSKSGFDSIEECYGDLSDHIFALETGLSSDPEMNRRVSKLDRFRLVSNSDAHSPSKLAREATVFDHKPDYYSMMNALQTGSGYVGTVEFFPEEGKYHLDGHRKCGVCLTPEETKELGGICPVCSKPLTIGVSYRVNELADRKESLTPKDTKGEVYSLVPLLEIVSEILGVGPSSKSAVMEYERLIDKFGSELSILQDIETEELSKTSPLLAQGISRLRKGDVIKHAGYDGEYGKISLFEEDECKKKKKYVNLKFDLNLAPQKPLEKPKLTPQVKEIQKKEEIFSPQLKTFDSFQKSAIESKEKQLLIIAGPGSGKTTVLTNRIAFLILKMNAAANNILAITFTRKAADEMRQRLEKLLGKKAKLINIHTFHSLCLSILRENFKEAGLSEDFFVMSEEEKKLVKDDNILNKALGFDDLISRTTELFEKNKDILLEYQNRFQYVSIDEYQDIDQNQYKLIRLLAPKSANICAIGDPNQAIYGFRGGDSKFFNNFEKDYPDSKVINLKNNYRSTLEIVNASNQMIESYNIVSKEEKLHEKITIHHTPTPKAEAEFIVSTIENLIGGHNFFSIDSNRASSQNSDYSFGDFAILYRASFQAQDIEEALDRAGMPYLRSSLNLLYDRKEIRELLSKIKGQKPLFEEITELCELYSSKIENYILEYIKNFSKEYDDKNDFIRSISLVNINDTFDKRADRIKIMSLHASKGLEFRCVFIVGLEDGILPFYLAKDEYEKEEEKRLLYVGMTRAKERLYLTHAAKRKFMGRMKNLPISPFLAKIKEDLLKLSKFEKEYKQKDNSQQLSLFSLQ